MSSHPWDWIGAWKIADTMNQTQLLSSRGKGEEQRTRMGVWGKQIIIWNEELQKSKWTCKGRPSGLSTLSHGVLIHWISIALFSLILNVSSKRPCSPWEAIAKSHKSSLPFTWLPLPLYSSFNFVFSWYSTVPLDIPVTNGNFFLKAFVPLRSLLSRKKLS